MQNKCFRPLLFVYLPLYRANYLADGQFGLKSYQQSNKKSGVKWIKVD